MQANITVNGQVLMQTGIITERTLLTMESYGILAVRITEVGLPPLAISNLLTVSIPRCTFKHCDMSVFIKPKCAEYVDLQWRRFTISTDDYNLRLFCSQNYIVILHS